jgi:hypothetical protein
MYFLKKETVYVLLLAEGYKFRLYPFVQVKHGT